MVDFGRGYGTAIRNYLPEEIPEGQELQDANELRRVQCPITLCNNLRLGLNIQFILVPYFFDYVHWVFSGIILTLNFAFSTRLIVQTTLSLIPRKKIQSLKRASQSLHSQGSKSSYLKKKQFTQNSKSQPVIHRWKFFRARNAASQEITRPSADRPTPTQGLIQMARLHRN